MWKEFDGNHKSGTTGFPNSIGTKVISDKKFSAPREFPLTSSATLYAVDSSVLLYGLTIKKHSNFESDNFK